MSKSGLNVHLHLCTNKIHFVLVDRDAFYDLSLDLEVCLFLTGNTLLNFVSCPLLNVELNF